MFHYVRQATVTINEDLIFQAIMAFVETSE